MKNEQIAVEQLLLKKMLLSRKVAETASGLSKQDSTATQQLDVKKRLFMRSRQVGFQGALDSKGS